MTSETPDRVIVNTQEPLHTLHKQRGYPTPLFRVCRTPDLKRVVSAWMVYDDMNKKFDVRKGWIPPSTPLPRPYEIRETEGKGRGMFATRKIAKGEVIVREMPLIMVARATAARSGSEWLRADCSIMQLLYWLEPEDRAVYLSLLNCKPEKECGPAAGIFRTNAIALDFGGSKLCSEYAAVCRDISLANHSCTPNAGYHSDQKTVTFELRADCDIESGEEICIRYTAILTTRDARLKELQTKYGFRCTCSDCADTPENVAKEDRRKFISTAISSLEKRMHGWMSCRPQSRATLANRGIEYCMQILHAMDGEKAYYGERMQVAQHLGYMYGGLGDRENFKKWSCETATLLRKGGNPMYIMWDCWHANPSMSALWNIVADPRKVVTKEKNAA